MPRRDRRSPLSRKPLAGTLFLRSLAAAIGVLVVGIASFRAGLIGSQHLALWPTYGLLDLDRFQGPQPASSLLFWFGLQVAIWTLLFFLLFAGLQVVRKVLIRAR